MAHEVVLCSPLALCFSWWCCLFYCMLLCYFNLLPFVLPTARLEGHNSSSFHDTFPGVVPIMICHGNRVFMFANCNVLLLVSIVSTFSFACYTSKKEGGWYTPSIMLAAPRNAQQVFRNGEGSRTILQPIVSYHSLLRCYIK